MHKQTYGDRVRAADERLNVACRVYVQLISYSTVYVEL